MKNFPHQFNDLTKLTAALGVAQGLIGQNQQYNDDAVFGTALANTGVYTFRNKALTVAQNLATESQKPPGNQGFRTAARDVRRFFALAGLITPALAITQLGKDILAAAGSVRLRNALWREAMLQLELPDPDGNTSHPYRILHRLIADRPGIESLKLLLALEARDDSPVEYARILGLADVPFDQLIAGLGIGAANARNAVKILPGIAEQVGDIERVGGHAFLRPHAGVSEDNVIEPETPPDYSASQAGAPAAFDPANIAPIPNFAAAGAVNVDLAASIQIRNRRIVEHQRTVTSIAQLLASFGYTTYANPYDCLGHRDQAGGMLIEVKTLDGSKSDERRQSERALGQLRGYAYYSVPDELKAPKLVEIAAYSARPTDSVAFMAANNVHSAWQDNGQWLVADLQGNITNFLPDALLA